MKTLDRELSMEYARKNMVSIEELLSSIHVFHEVISPEYNMAGHPSIQLYPDGSGCVLPPTQYTKVRNIEGKFIDSEPLFHFNNIIDLVNEASRLCLKYSIKWE